MSPARGWWRADEVATPQVGYVLGCPPSQDASDHQDYYIFSRDSYKPSFATITGKGDNPRYVSFCWEGN